MNIVKTAEELARKAHQGQERKGGAPYITHPERVANLISETGFDELTIAAAWLHDALEDTNLSQTEIMEINPELLDIIKSVTEDGHLPWVERKRQFTDKLKLASARAKAVACADRIDNLTNFLSDYKKVGQKLWESWPERTPQEKLASDQYFLKMLKATWENELVEKLENLVNEEVKIVKK